MVRRRLPPAVLNLFGAAWILGLLAVATPVAAAPGPPRRIALLAVPGEDELRFAEALAAEVTDLDVDVVVVSPEVDRQNGVPAELSLEATLARAKNLARREGTLAAIWVDKHPEGLRLFLYDATSGEVIVKSVPRATNGASAAANPMQAGRILAILARGMLREALRDVPHLVFAAPSPARVGAGAGPAVPQLARRPPSWAVEVGYTTYAFASDSGLQHGGELRVERRLAAPFAVGLRAAAFAPIEVVKAAATTSLGMYAAEATSRLDAALGPGRAVLELCAGVLLPTADSRKGDLTSDHVAAVPALRLAVGYDVPIGGAFFVAAQIGTALVLDRPRYLIGGVQVLELRSLAPGGGLGVGLRLR